MTKTTLHISLFLFVLTALTGIWMRLTPFVDILLPYEHILHAHSHTAMLGWAFIGCIAIFLKLFWAEIKNKKEAKWIVWALFIDTILMLIAFLYQGYGVLSIAMSTVHIFIEYWCVTFIYRTLKNKKLPRSGRLFLSGSLFALVLSSVGPFLLGMMPTQDLRSSMLYLYLHFQYNGWLTLFLIGMFLIFYKLESKRIHLAFWIYFISLFPGYFTNIIGINEGFHYIASIGAIGQWVAIILFLLEIKKNWSKFNEKLLLLLTFFLLLVKSSMELLLIFPALAEFTFSSHNVIIGYLHLTLLGFISIFILTQLYSLRLFQKRTFTTIGFSVFVFGFALNEIVLFLSSIVRVYQQNLLVLISSILLLIGILILWRNTEKTVD